MPHGSDTVAFAARTSSGSGSSSRDRSDSTRSVSDDQLKYLLKRLSGSDKRRLSSALRKSDNSTLSFSISTKRPRDESDSDSGSPVQVTKKKYKAMISKLGNQRKQLRIFQGKGKKKAGFSFGVADSDDEDELGAYSATTSSPAGTP